MLTGIAFLVAQRGTCSRLKVGSVFSRDGRIISTGYNGVPAGMPHCIHEEYVWHEPYTLDELPEWMMEFLSHWPVSERPPREGTHFYYDGSPEVTVAFGSNEPELGCTQAEHAERNAIAFAARWGLALEGAEVHNTHAPCLACARTLINAGITRLTYSIPYRRTDGVELLRAAGIEVVDPAVMG